MQLCVSRFAVELGGRSTDTHFLVVKWESDCNAMSYVEASVASNHVVRVRPVNIS